MRTGSTFSKEYRKPGCGSDASTIHVDGSRWRVGNVRCLEKKDFVLVHLFSFAVYASNAQAIIRLCVADTVWNWRRTSAEILVGIASQNPAVVGLCGPFAWVVEPQR